MTFPTMSTLPKEQRPDFLLWSKWMAYAKSISEQAQYKRQIVEKIGSWLTEEKLQTMILKGFSLAVLYPQPDLRESCDIDIYSGADYDAVNACFEKHGIDIGKPDGHHVHLKIDSVTVEHHFALHNSRVRSCMNEPVEALQRLAATDIKATALPGINFPNAAFTALFTGWHAYKHFLHEKVELRHIIDWALALRQLSETDAETISAVKAQTGWGRFTEVMTAIALHRLNLPQEWFPQKEVERAEAVTKEQEQRVWDDIMSSGHTAHGRTSNHRRMNIARRMLQNRWKFEAFAEMSAERFLWKEFVGYMKNRKA